MSSPNELRERATQNSVSGSSPDVSPCPAGNVRPRQAGTAQYVSPDSAGNPQPRQFRTDRHVSLGPLSSPYPQRFSFVRHMPQSPADFQDPRQFNMSQKPAGIPDPQQSSMSPGSVRFLDPRQSNMSPGSAGNPDSQTFNAARYMSPDPAGIPYPRHTSYAQYAPSNLPTPIEPPIIPSYAPPATIREFKNYPWGPGTPLIPLTAPPGALEFITSHNPAASAMTFPPLEVAPAMPLSGLLPPLTADSTKDTPEIPSIAAKEYPGNHRHERPQGDSGEREDLMRTVDRY
jgi:hypothetical protein